MTDTSYHMLCCLCLPLSLSQVQAALQRAQDRERGYVGSAFSRAQELETGRQELVSQVLGAASDSYKVAMLPLQSEVEQMGAAMQHNGSWGEHASAGANRRLDELTK